MGKMVLKTYVVHGMAFESVSTRVVELLFYSVTSASGSLHFKLTGEGKITRRGPRLTRVGVCL